MPPADDRRRTAIASKIADHLLEHGLAASRLRPLAAAAGLSDRMLLYHFPDKAAAVAAGLAVIAGRMAHLLVPAEPPRSMPLPIAERQLRRMVLDPLVWPYMRLWLELAHAAASGDAALAPIARQLGEGFLALAESLIEGEGAARQRDAARLLAITEGTVLLKAIGLEAAIARLDT